MLCLNFDDKIFRDDAEDSEEEISVDFDDEQRQNSRRDKINNEAADQTDLSAI